MVNPRSAITEMFCFPLSFSIRPQTRVSPTSDMDPTYKSEAKLIAPFGVHATSTLPVL